METVSRFDKNLRLLLEQRQKSVQWLSKTTGIPEKTLYHWLNGQRPRDITQVKKVSRTLHVSMEDLIFAESPLASSVLETESPPESNTNVLANETEITLKITIKKQDNMITAQLVLEP